MLRKILPILLILLLLCGCAGEASPAPQAAQVPTVSEIVKTFPKDSQKAKAMADDLAEADPRLGGAAGSLLEYWSYVNNNLTLNPILPDGLEEGGLCILVLGFQLNADGTIRPELEGRLQTALACAQKYPGSYVLCTGGGTAANAPEATEAGQMALWLVGNGLEPERLIVEDQSLTTTENALFSHAILKEQYPQITTAAIVTSDYHIPWGAVLFEAEFLFGTEDAPIHIVSNAAFPTTRTGMDMTPYQLSGLQELLRYHQIS